MVTSTIVILCMLLFAFSLGLYVAVALGITAMVVGFVSFGSAIFDMFGHIVWNCISSQTITVVPLFFLMGEMLLRSGITDEVYEVVSKWLNNLPGGMLYTNIGSCAMFASISGSSLATVSTIGSVALPAMLRRGYNEAITVGSIAAGGTLGILIPPSIVFIVYGLLAEVSIGQLYIAAIVPGLLMTLAFCLLILVFCIISPRLAPRSQANLITWKERIVSLAAAFPIVILFLLVVGTIYMGIATAIESAAFGAVGAFVLALFKRKVNINMLKEVFVSTASNTAMMIFILVGAFLIQFIIAFLGIPEALSQWVISLKLSPLMLVIYVCILYAVLGMFLETLAMLVTTIPILVPMLNALNIDLIWFGLIATIMFEMSLITPPVGMNLFVIQGVRRQVEYGSKNKSIADTYRGATPFVISMILVLVLLIAFPQITTFLLK